jgi:hypothetical protein
MLDGVNCQKKKDYPEWETEDHPRGPGEKAS